MTPDDLLSDAIRSTNSGPPLEDIPAGEAPPEIIGGDWKDLLHVKGKNDEPRPVLINVDMALRFSPEWHGVLAFDEFKQKMLVLKDPPIGGACPRDWTDADSTKTAVWMQANGIYVGRDTVSNAVECVAFENRIHGPRSYLQSLTWDGTHRLATWLPTFMGTEKNAYTAMIGQRWMIAAVARIMRPGCQADYMLVLEGAQGVKKSTALKTLASQEWFCDHTPDLHDKDSQLQLFGSWIIEWGELDALRRADVTAVKSFLTRRVEKLRPPYGRYVIEVPRQCIFAGTTNERNWLKDETGGRRFWPVWCEKIDIDALEKFRDQLWAEAYTLFHDGAIWWPEGVVENESLSEQQDARMDQDPWEETIAAYLRGDPTSPDRIEVTIADVLANCMKISILNQGHAEKLRVGRVMKSLGWKYSRERIPNSKDFWNGYRK